MPFQNIGAIAVNDTWTRLVEPLNSQLLQITFSDQANIQEFTYLWLRTRIGSFGYSTAWMKVFYAREPILVIVPIIPPKPNQLEMKIGGDKTSRGQTFVATINEWRDDSDGLPFTVGGQTFNINGEEFSPKVIE